MSARTGQLPSRAPDSVDRLQHLAVDIELQLVNGCVADSDWFRSTITIEIFEDVLGDPVIAVDRVHDLETFRVSLVRLSHPADETIGLLVEPHLKQGVDQVGCVSD